MRSGTTSLARYLGAHPDVHVAPKKEVHFFDHNFELGVEWYRQQFTPGDATAVGDVTPSYMFHADAVARMAATLPDARLLAILRNPVDRAYSHYWQNRVYGNERRPFEQAVRTDPARRGRPAGYVEMGRYLPQLQRLCEHYDRDRLKVLLFDDLDRHPADVVADAFAFLGVDPAIPVPPIVGARLNDFQHFRSLRVRRLGQRLPKRAADLVGRFNRVEATYPPIDAELRTWLAGEYAADNDALAAWLERDLSAWAA
jgi:hypothetical protein